MAVEDKFKKLLGLQKDFEIDQKIAEGFAEREQIRQSFYAQKETSQNNFDFYREYVIWKSKKKRKKPV